MLWRTEKDNVKKSQAIQENNNIKYNNIFKNCVKIEQKYKNENNIK